MITIDKDGKIIDYYAERNTEIKAKLQPALDALLEQKKKDLKGIQKFGYRFAVNLDACLRSYGLMSAEEFAHLQYEALNFSSISNFPTIFELGCSVVASMFMALFLGAFLRVISPFFASSISMI